MSKHNVHGVILHWCVGPVPESMKNLIKKHKDLLSNVGLELKEFYSGETEWMLVSNGTEEIKITAHFNKMDGSWIGIK